MSLYGRVDSVANQTQAGLARGNGAGSATETIVFVDETEAGLAANKARGLSSPGWWSYRTYTDAAGKTRHKAEQLAFITNPEANVVVTVARVRARRTRRPGARLLSLQCSCVALVSSPCFGRGEGGELFHHS